MIRFTLAATIAAVAAVALAPPAVAKPGQLDVRFGTRGIAMTRALDGGFAAMLHRRRIVVAGGIESPGLARFTLRGRRDRRFGRRGIARASRRDLLPLDVGRIPGRRLGVTTGTTIRFTAPAELLRFTRGGRRLAHRVHETHFAGPVAAGIQRRDGGAYILARDGTLRAIMPDGTLDTSFGGGTVAPLTPQYFTEYDPAGLALRRDGRLLVSVALRRGRGVAQYLPDGTLDPAWGRDGIAPVPVAAQALRILRNGDVAGGGGGYSGTKRRGVFRLSRRGALRRSFGARGAALRGHRAIGAIVRDLAEDRRGRIYALVESSYGVRSWVVAVTRRGRRVKRFGRKGRARIPRVRDWGANLGHRLLPDRRGGLIVVGSRFTDGSAHPAFGCGIREDFCATDIRLALWRFRLR